MTFFDRISIQDFKDNEDGAGTTFAIFMAIACIAVAGLSIDASNAWSVKQRLQSATDVAAHAAVLEMVWPDDRDDTTPAEAALNALLVNMPADSFGVALDPQDVVIGRWNAMSEQMTNANVDANGKVLMHAVQVTTRLDGQVGDLIPTFLLQVIGFDSWAANATSVFIRDTPACVDDGFIAAGTLDFASNNTLLNQFCGHGNEGVDFNDNIYFGSGVHISMPDKTPVDQGGMLNLRGDNYTWVDGKENQIGEQYINPYLTSEASIAAMIADLEDPNNVHTPDYINSSTVNYITVTPSNPIEEGDLIRHAINVVDCPNPGLNFSAGFELRDMVIIADCKVGFASGVSLQDVTIATTNTGNQSFNASSGLTLGRDDHCAPGGGVNLITAGDVSFAAQVEWYGVQMIAHGDVHISAISDGIEGAAIQSGGDIFATSNLDFGICNGGVDHYREHYMIRMVL